MKQRKRTLVRAVAAGGCCAMMAGMPSLKADTPQPKAQLPTLPRIGWGEPQDGLQIGLFPQSRQKTLRYGDTLSLFMRVRNVSHTPIALTMKAPQISSVTLGESGRLALQTLGGSDAITPLRLAPGETRDLPGGRYAAQIVAPGEQPQAVANGLPVLALLPGEYHAECSYPIWIPDKDDVTRATAHRAKPGQFTFLVRDDGRHPQANNVNKPESKTAIVWGEMVNGLQGGLLRVTDKDLAALPAEERKEIAADEVLVRFYVRNATDRPLRLTYHNFGENDASFWVKDAQGKDQMVRSTFFTGARATQERTLQPGEKMQAGEGRFRWQAQEAARETGDYTPLLTAAPGQYTVRLISSVRFWGSNAFDMALVSGAIPFSVSPQ